MSEISALGNKNLSTFLSLGTHNKLYIISGTDCAPPWDPLIQMLWKLYVEGNQAVT